MRRLASTCAFVVASFMTVVYAEESEVSFAYVPAPDAESVVVEQPLGKLQVRGWDKPEVRIVAHKRAPDAATLDRLRVNVEMNDGHIRIRAGVRVGGSFRPLPPEARSQIGIDLTVDAPRRVSLDARTWAGDLDAEGFRAGARLASTGGEVRASDIEGKVTSNTVKGRQHLSAIKGDVQADGVTGDMEFDTVDGAELDAKVVEGQITARGVRAQVVHLFSTMGGIVMVGSIRPGALYALRTEQGDVRLVLDRAPFSVTARAPAGRVATGFPVKGELLPTGLRGDFLGGGARLDLTAVSGNVTIDPAR
jgi:DUF4097 and DUF4098 domain-containing protein YvlB